MSVLRVGESRLGIGRGVFSTRQIEAGEVFEQSPVLVLSVADREAVDKTALFDYYFDWVEGTAALAFGFGSLFNHSFTPNARYVKNPEMNTIDFIAVHLVPEGDEIFVNYNGDPNSRQPLWFEPVE